MSLAVEDTQDDIPEACDGDGAPDGLGPLAASKVNQMQPRPSAEEDRAGVRLGLASDWVLVHVQCEQEVRVAAL